MIQYLINGTTRKEYPNTIYLITHGPTGLQYIGQTNGPVECRFYEHMNGWGALTIIALMNSGYTANDFKLDILDTCWDYKEANDLETHYIRLFETGFPTGLNLERSSNLGISFKRDYALYNDRGWCTSWLSDRYVSKSKQRKYINTQLQDIIDIWSRYQRYLPDMVSDAKNTSYWKIRIKAVERYQTDEGRQQMMVGRKKLQDRRANGDSTEKEKLADTKRKSTQKRIWDERSSEERSELHAKSIGVSNVRMVCPVCGVESTRANILRYHIRGKCADAYNNQNYEKNIPKSTASV